MPQDLVLFRELCITHKFSKRSPSNPNGIPPQSPGLGGTTYPGNNVQEAFSTPKVLRQSSAIWAQPRWGCFEQGPKTQGRPAAVAVGQPWAGGRNPVGIRGNEAAPQIANLWVMHSSRGGGRFSPLQLRKSVVAYPNSYFIGPTPFRIPERSRN